MFCYSSRLSEGTRSPSFLLDLIQRGAKKRCELYFSTIRFGLGLGLSRSGYTLSFSKWRFERGKYPFLPGKSPSLYLSLPTFPRHFALRNGDGTKERTRAEYKLHILQERKEVFCKSAHDEDLTRQNDFATPNTYWTLSKLERPITALPLARKALFSLTGPDPSSILSVGRSNDRRSGGGEALRQSCLAFLPSSPPSAVFGAPSPQGRKAVCLPCLLLA